MVAPARERGLKCSFTGEGRAEVDGRSREGAWIEIRPARQAGRPRPRRSREGAWIEIEYYCHSANQ